MVDTAASGPAGQLSWTKAAWILIALMTLARVLALAFHPLDLYADETQYWVWSLSFDWGYFSKPPMIAWLIGLSTAVFGDSDFAVRLPSPLLHAVTATFITLIATRLWSARHGFFAALLYLFMPAVWLSSSVITTDALLLAAWSGALYALLRLREAASWPAAIGLGIAIGLGFMSKYAMIYFVVGTAITILIDPPTRKALLSLQGLAATAIALAIWAPNLIWNAANDFATVSHTAANANWGGSLFHPSEMLEFLTDQLGVFGPLMFPVFVGVVIALARRPSRIPVEIRLLLAFALPPILAVSAQAFISRAHANWAGAAYVAATLIMTWVLLQPGLWRRLVLWVSLAFHTFVAAVVIVAAVSPAVTDALNLDNATKRIRAWTETGAVVAERGMEEDYAAIVFDNRNVFHQMQRYADGLDRPLRMWLRYSGPVNHAEQEWPLEEQFDGMILIISERPREVPRMREDFAVFEPAGTLSIPLDGGRTRDFTLWHASGHQRVQRDAAYEERWQAIDAAASTP